MAVAYGATAPGWIVLLAVIAIVVTLRLYRVAKGTKYSAARVYRLPAFYILFTAVALATILLTLTDVTIAAAVFVAGIIVGLRISGGVSFSDRRGIVYYRRSDSQKLYDVYRDWRSKGYVIKSGFKFGTHFRVYFPGASPVKSDSEWIHSKHVLHVFPRDTKLLISEWARAIRVAHSVRKTFILAIPGKSRMKKLAIDYVLYHRHNGNIEVPGTDSPRYAMLSLGENEYIGGSELAAVINETKSRKLELIIAIADRETSVTYYKVRRISLPKSDYEYYEIDWMQP